LKWKYRIGTIIKKPWHMFEDKEAVMDLFISKEILDMLSYTSTLDRSLKQISLRDTPLDKI